MKKLVMVLGTIFFVTAFSEAQKSEVFISNGVAVHGYDVVSYFSDGKPVKGNNEFFYQWNNATWYFASKQHLDVFKADPLKYAPQFGGYCAYGVSENHKAPTQTDAWTIVNGKLYLNYDTGVRALWKKDTDKRIDAANKNWPAIKDKE
jgi:YHS domain-containing protein